MAEFYHKENPFIKELRKQVRVIMRSRKRVGPIMNSTTGEFISDENGLVMVTTHTGAFPTFEDDCEFIKLYIDNIKILRTISAAGILIFTYVLEVAKPKQDLVYLNSSMIAEKLDISRTYVYDGIRSLCAEQVIARAYTGKRSAVAYWINPTIFYNGNRQHLLLKPKQK
jgi:hypothetical protein